MSHLGEFRISWKPFSCFSNKNVVLSGEEEKEAIICVRVW